ncbi:MAG: hypothetical protein V1661_02025 [bacterium]
MPKKIRTIRKKKAMTSEQARTVRQAGHDDAKQFAHLIGLSSDYQNDPQAKKDVIDLVGDPHSVKSGMKKWQIFLYSPSRFEKDTIFKRLNGLGQLLLNCLNVFPNIFKEYEQNKSYYKNLLKGPMQVLKERLQDKETLKAFFEKSFFNAGEVIYLTIKHNNAFYVFHSDDVIKILTENIVVDNSIGEQKVVFKIKNINLKTSSRFPMITIGEIEMRNDSNVHFKEIKFWMGKDKTLELLRNSILLTKEVKQNLFLYGRALKTFKKY